MNRVTVLSGSAVLALVLSGCGGGGGGGGIPSAAAVADPPLPSEPATGTINSGSVLTVAGRSVNAALQSGSFGDIADFVGLTAVASSGPSSIGSGAIAKPGGSNGWSQVPFGPETTRCEVDGSVTVSGDIANPLTVTEGDFLDYDWDSCNDGLDQVVDGFIGMTFTEFEGNLLSGSILLGIALDLEDFQVTKAADFNRTDGGMSLTIDSRTKPNTIVVTRGSSLIVSNEAGTETLTNFSSSVTENTSAAPSSFTTDAAGTISSNLFGGAVNYEMAAAFQSTGDDYPYAGEMVVTGTSNARIRIIALSAASVRIQADYDGDGAPDATIDTTWNALIDG
ncbi:MAG: hypothetical protein ACR2Q3_09145 [Woeseiaceae bacterium]